MEQKELINELLDGGTQSIGDDLKMKEENEMCKDISIGKNQNFILMKEKVEQSRWIVMKCEEKEDVLSKNMIGEYNFIIVKYDMDLIILLQMALFKKNTMLQIPFHLLLQQNYVLMSFFWKAHLLFLRTS